MNARMFVGGGIIITLMVAAMAYGGSVASFVDPPSLLIVFGITIGATVWSSPVADIRLAARLGFGSSAVAARPAQRAWTVLQRAADASVAAGTIGTVIGLVSMLQNLDNPSAIGPAMAVALLTLLYGVVVGEVFLRSVAADVLARIDGGDALPTPRRGTTTLYASLFSLMVVLGAFLLMMLAMS